MELRARMTAPTRLRLQPSFWAAALEDSLIKNEALMVVPSPASHPVYSADTAAIAFQCFERFQHTYRIDIASWFLLTSVYFSNTRDSNPMMLALTPVSAIELARMTGLSRETVRRKLQVLLHKGLVRKINRSWVVTDLCVHGSRISV